MNQHLPTALLAGLTIDRAAHSRQVARTVTDVAPKWCGLAAVTACS